MTDLPGATLILGGDIFHNTSPSGAMEYAFKLGMDELLGKGHRVLFITGNHDDEDVPRPLLFGAEQMEDGRVYDAGGLTVSGINYSRVDEAVQQALSSAPPCDMLVMHTGFRHLLGFADTWQCTEEDIPEHVGAVLVGHVHKRSIKGKVHSPGALCVNSTEEFDPDDHGYFVGTKEGIEWRRLPGRVFRSVIFDESTDGVLAALAAGDHALPPVVNLIHTNEEEDRVADTVGRYPGIVFMLNVKGGTLANSLEPEWQDGLDLGAVVLRSIEETVPDGQARGLAVSLITAQDPAAALAKYLEAME